MIKDTYIRARVSNVEKELYTELAQQKGITLSDLIRELLINEYLKTDKKETR